MTDGQISAIRDEHLPSQGEPFDTLAFARAVLAASRETAKAAEGWWSLDDAGQRVHYTESQADVDWWQQHGVAFEHAAASPEQHLEIERLTQCLKTANAQMEDFERKWYLATDEVERLKPTANYIGWAHWVDTPRCPVLRLCGSDSAGAFKIYRSVPFASQATEAAS